jgi:hypothetical protein
MDFVEICLIIAGIVCIIASFVFSGIYKTDEKTEDVAKASLSKADMDELKAKIDSMMNERVEDALDKTEISMEKLSNAKIMAISEYSDTVLSQIKTNHEEVMFLYDMLNSKADSLKKIPVAAPVSNVSADVSAVAAPSIVTASNVVAAPENNQQNVRQDAQRNNQRGKKNHNKQGRNNQVNQANQAVQQQAVPVQRTETDEELLAKQARLKNMSPNKDQILELSRRGMSNVDIAKQLGIGIGEVRLVVDLYKNEGAI